MLTLAQAILDRAAAGHSVAQPDLESVPAVQWEIYWDELSKLCPSTIAPEPIKQRNALRIELLPDSGPRCIRRSPDGRGSVWLLSGGSPLAYGRCCAAQCPRAKERS